MPDNEDWWNAEIVARSVLEEAHPIIRTDDDIAEDDIDSLTAFAVPTLAMLPIIEDGLVAADLRRVLEFANSNDMTHRATNDEEQP